VLRVWVPEGADDGRLEEEAPVVHQDVGQQAVEGALDVGGRFLMKFRLIKDMF
jgi:hypothetical protein